MSGKTGPRPGGRSARIQQQVHEAVRFLQKTGNPEDLSVPKIAVQAGVTPSTIYRRWGDLQGVLQDVALEAMRPDEDPVDCGSLHDDVLAWLEQYLDELGTVPGRALIRDMISGVGAAPGHCARFTRQTVDILLDRAVVRGDPVPARDDLMDFVVAPLLYRVLFAAEKPTTAEVDLYLRRVLAQAGPPRPTEEVP